MIHRVSAPSVACLLILTALSVQAQGLRPATRTSPAASTVTAAQGAVRQADFIVAVVNSEPVTNHDVAVELQRMQQQYAQQRQALPDTRELTRQVLERLINEKAQLQLARETGIKVDEPSVDQAEQSVALQNQLSVAELHRRIAQDGVDPKQFREQLRNQLLLTRLREREVEPKVRVSDLEVEQYLQEQLAVSNVPANQVINIAQLLVAVPENASETQVAALQAKAQRALERARAGEDFTVLARELSDAADRASGGQLGLRPADRYPPLFLDATRSLAVGGISELVRSGAGFHILKLVEKRNAGLPPMVITQSHARHILLRPNAQLSEAAARDKLNDFRRRIQTGQTDFATLARENSQDGSAEQGGDLGWAYPGQFVPEFEAVMNRLAPGQISQPLISRFGVHLIQLLERRNTTLGEREQREMVRNMLREKKLDEAYANWARDVRARAYVEMREPPQ
ncbi:MAG: molecular chaperone SurA [Curvibacter sp. GWA2_64_110]|nr:MAG: molecular chaperone SurA [Curvibacter sp. GWA2_64_110]HCY14710.1 molecular chaperone SurA [Curvibacter sp.]